MTHDQCCDDEPGISAESQGMVGEQKTLQFIRRELFHIRKKLAEHDRRLDVAEERPQEILQELHRIWLTDPETCPSTGKPCQCHKPESFEA
jgi:hypothetical protein